MFEAMDSSGSALHYSRSIPRQVVESIEWNLYYARRMACSTGEVGVSGGGAPTLLRTS